MDVLGADVGEICGGSLREERLPILEDRLDTMGIKANYEWQVVVITAVIGTVITRGRDNSGDRNDS